MSNVMYEKRGDIAIVTMTHPEALNALNTETLNQLYDCVIEIESDESLRVLIITGEGKAFVAGADITEMSELGLEAGRSFGQSGQRVFDAIASLEIPTIAAVNGFALGGGLELAMSCDLRVASEKAKFGQPEVTLGITPGFAGTQRLPRLVGIAKAKELILTGAMIKADEALEIGLINRVVENALDGAIELAESIAKNAPLAVKYSKIAIDHGMATTLQNGEQIEANLFAMCFATEDQKKGMKAFLNKEKVVFTGK